MTDLSSSAPLIRAADEQGDRLQLAIRASDSGQDLDDVPT